MPPEAVVPEFQRLQAGFTDYIRDPEAYAPPAGVDRKRMDLYAELFFNGFNSHLSLNFPVLRGLYDDADWTDLVRDFMRRHRCRTPLFTEIAQEFLNYLEHERPGLPQAESDPPFLWELAHYEWVELALYIADEKQERDGIDPNGDLLDGLPVVSSLAWPLVYRFDVHRIGPDHRPQEPPEQPSHLVVYRQRDEDIGFIEINAVSHRLLQLLDGNRAMTGLQAAERIARELQHPNPPVVIAGARDILDGMRAREIILGARPAPALDEDQINHQTEKTRS